MISNGTRPLPTALKIARGTARPDRIRQDEPRALPVTNLRPPAWLDTEGKKAFRRLAKYTQRLRVLSDSDLPLLALLADQWAIYMKASSFLRQNGETYMIRDKDGNVRAAMPFPQVAQRNACVKAIHRLSVEFGLSPSGRTRVSSDVIERGPGSKDALEEFLGASA
jgi:P27 family predicted phage terminase small subunit